MRRTRFALVAALLVGGLAQITKRRGRHASTMRNSGPTGAIGWQLSDAS